MMSPDREQTIEIASIKLEIKICFPHLTSVRKSWIWSVAYLIADCRATTSELKIPSPATLAQINCANKTRAGQMNVFM